MKEITLVDFNLQQIVDFTKMYNQLSDVEKYSIFIDENGDCITICGPTILAEMWNVINNPYLKSWKQTVNYLLKEV